MRTLIAVIALLMAIGSAEGTEYRSNDVRPWAAFVSARRAMQEAGVRGTDEAAGFMTRHLGPLPWRFAAEPNTPNANPAVVRDLIVTAEDDGFHQIHVLRARFEYPGVVEGVSRRDVPIYSQIENLSPREDLSKYRWSAPGGTLYR